MYIFWRKFYKFLYSGRFLQAVAEFIEELAAKYWIELATVVHFTF